jgi:hypothetical protein
MKPDAVRARATRTESQPRRLIRPGRRVAALLAFISVVAGLDPVGLLGVCPGLCRRAVAEVPAPVKPGDPESAQIKPGDAGPKLTGPDDLAPAPPPAPPGGVVRLRPGDKVPDSLKRQAEVLRTALVTLLPVGDLQCRPRIKSGEDDCEFEGGTLYDRKRLHAGETTSQVRVYLYSVEDELRGIGQFSTEAGPYDPKKNPQYPGPPERLDAGVRGYIQSHIALLYRWYGWYEGGTTRFSANGGTRAEFLCGNALVVVEQVKQSSNTYPASPQTNVFPSAESRPGLDADIIRMGEEVIPETKKLAQKIAQTFAEALAREKIDVNCGTPAIEPAPDVPELPLIIPAAALEGTLKPWLQAKKTEIEGQFKVAKALKDSLKPVEMPLDAGELDAIGFLDEWYKQEKGILVPERAARQGAEEFFKKLALAYGDMSDDERAKLQKGFEARAFGLRAFRTRERTTMREHAGKIERAELQTYYTAVARATWAAQELDALVRMWGWVNAARVAYHGRYDAYAIDDASDAKLAADASAAQGKHFEAMVDMTLAAMLASETRFEAVSDARKSRLYGLREGWKDTAEAAYDDPKIGRNAAHVVVQLLADGFTLFDIAAGYSADTLKPGLNWILGKLPDDTVLKWLTGDGFRTRAQKLDDQAIKNWDDTQRKLVILRLLKARPLTEVRELAKQAAAGTDPKTLKISPKVDEKDIGLLLADRTVYDATQGGLLRLLATTLTGFNDRCTMELRIAQDETRLIKRDMQAAYRLEQGMDPETGDITWGTTLSPMAWADLVTKNIFSAADYGARMAEMRRKDQQIVTMDLLLKGLPKIDFDYGRLQKQAPQTAHDEVLLLNRSAPYLKFTVRLAEERANLQLHELGAHVRRLGKEPDDETKAAIRNYEDMIAYPAKKARAQSQVRIYDLEYQDYIYAWDLGSALALAETLSGNAPAMRQAAERLAQAAKPDDWYAQWSVKQLQQGAELTETYTLRAERLRNAIAAQHLKDHGVPVFRNVGDMGIMAATFSFLGGVAPSPSAALWPVAEEMSFANYLLGSFQPLTHGAQAVATQAITEVLVDVGIPHTGEKSEALLNQLISIAVDIPMSRLAQSFSKARARVKETIVAESQRIEYAQLDPRRYLADVMNRGFLLLTERFLKWSGRAEAARDPAVGASIERQAAAEDGRGRRWLMLESLAEHAQRLQASLTDAVQDVTVTQFLEMRRQVEMMAAPLSIDVVERVLQDHKDDLFRLDYGLDIARLRIDLHWLRLLASPEEIPRLNTLEQGIDQERHARFAQGLGEFLQAGHGQIEKVILNGAQPGSPEYRGLSSDLDFTVLVAPGTQTEGLQKAAEAAFEKHGIRLNAKGRPTSVDVELMMQDFLPGEVRPVRSEADLKEWLSKMSKDPGRYLAGGGAEWVGLLNHLTGQTVHLEGGTAAIDPTPDMNYLPQPELHPILAHGLVLDVARFDKLREPGSIADTATLAEMTEKRAKFVLRAVDALIWAEYPALLRARTREAAAKEGYHKLIVEDARKLVERSLLSPQEFETIQYLLDLKAGKSVVVALDLDPKNLDGGRARLEEIWRGMNELMRHAYNDTRAVYLRYLGEFAKTSGGMDAEDLFTFAFRNWMATKKIPPEALAFLMPKDAASAPGEPALAERLKREDRDTIAAGLDSDFFPADRPPPIALAAGQPEPEVLPERERRDDPSPISDANVAPTKLESARAPPKEVEPPFKLEEIAQPLDLAAVEKRDDEFAYLGERRVAVENGRIGEAPDPEYFAPEHEVAAYQLGRLLSANIPWAGLGTSWDGKTEVAFTRWVRTPGEPPRGRPGPFIDFLGILTGTVTYTPPAFDQEILKPFRGPDGKLTPEARNRMAAGYMADLLVSLIQGAPDRKSNNYVLTPDGQVTGIDHTSAYHRETDIGTLLGRDCAQRMILRLQRNKHVLALPKALGITHQEIVAAWRAVKEKLTYSDGTLDPEVLRSIAKVYGDQAEGVLKTWNRRILVMDHVLAKLFGAEYELRPMELQGWDTDHKNHNRYFTPDELQARRVEIRDGKLYDAAGKLIDSVVRDADGKPKIPVDAQGNPMMKNGQPVYEHRALLYVMDGSGQFYVTLEETGIKHSSFFHGEGVAAAGHIELVDGVLVRIDNGSGHYLPEQKYLDQAATQLKKSGVAVEASMVDGLLKGSPW